jgi:acyl-homoserine-lactone acylase
MKRVALLVLLCLVGGCRHASVPVGPGVGLVGGPEAARWEQRAQRVTIARDDWGIPHVRGRTDADAVFGLMYAQAEDDFNRIETNYLSAMGQLAEAEGEKAISRDLRVKLFVDPARMKAHYESSPAWLKALMDAWAEGLNYYLATHPEVTPRVIRRFEPWMALTFTEGSIGADIETIRLADLEAFYGLSKPRTSAANLSEWHEAEPSGSMKSFMRRSRYNAVSPSASARRPIAFR